jgi:hypothetical protein
LGAAAPLASTAQTKDRTPSKDHRTVLNGIL